MAVGGDPAIPGRSLSPSPPPRPPRRAPPRASAADGSTRAARGAPELSRALVALVSQTLALLLPMPAHALRPTP